MDMMGKGTAKSMGVGMSMADYRKNVIASGLENTMSVSPKQRLAQRMMASKKKAKPMGYRTQGPDAQYNTMMMGKQPVAVFPRLKGQR